MKIDSKVIKVILMSKYRFKDGLLVASECCGHGGGIADIITYNHKKGIMVEIEIKISKQDLKNDLKKMKHFLYTDFKNTYIQKFYYAVPTFMVDYTLKFLEDNNLTYGVIEIIEDKAKCYDFGKVNDCSELVQVVKKCKRFSNNKPLDSQVNTFLKRLSSELVAMEREILELKNSIFGKVENKG